MKGSRPWSSFRNHSIRSSFRWSTLYTRHSLLCHIPICYSGKYLQEVAIQWKIFDNRAVFWVVTGKFLHLRVDSLSDQLPKIQAPEEAAGGFKNGDSGKYLQKGCIYWKIFTKFGFLNGDNGKYFTQPASRDYFLLSQFQDQQANLAIGGAG